MKNEASNSIEYHRIMYRVIYLLEDWVGVEQKIQEFCAGYSLPPASVTVLSYGITQVLIMTDWIKGQRMQ